MRSRQLQQLGALIVTESSYRCTSLRAAGSSRCGRLEMTAGYTAVGNGSIHSSLRFRWCLRLHREEHTHTRYSSVHISRASGVRRLWRRLLLHAALRRLCSAAAWLQQAGRCRDRLAHGAQVSSVQLQVLGFLY